MNKPSSLNLNQNMLNMHVITPSPSVGPKTLPKIERFPKFSTEKSEVVVDLDLGSSSRSLDERALDEHDMARAAWSAWEA